LLKVVVGKAEGSNRQQGLGRTRCVRKEQEESDRIRAFRGRSMIWFIDPLDRAHAWYF
jgi:hypothetical protein